MVVVPVFPAPVILIPGAVIASVVSVVFSWVGVSALGLGHIDLTGIGVVFEVIGGVEEPLADFSEVAVGDG